jgi:hypothetical protein
MAGEIITIRLDGAAVAVQTFLEEIEHFSCLLREVDADLSEQPHGTLRWVVDSLDHGSFVVALRPESVGASPDYPPKVFDAIVKGLGALEGPRLEDPPEHFSHQALEQVSSLVKPLRDGLSWVSIRAGNSEVSLSRRTESNVIRLTGAKYEMIGTIEGRLQMVSISGGPHFSVRDQVTGKSVRCSVPTEMLAQAVRSFEQRVAVFGRLLVTRRGDVASIKVEEIRLLGAEEELPTTGDIAGAIPDLTYGLRAEEHVRRLRNGD